MTRHLTSCRLLAWMLLLLVAIPPAVAPAATITIASNTNWSAISTGSGAGGQPNNTDDIIVKNGKTLTVDVTNGACRSLQLGQSGTSAGAGTLFFGAGSGRQVTVSGTGIGAGIVNFGDASEDGSADMTNGGTLKSQGWATQGKVGTWDRGTGTVVFTATNTLPDDGELDTFNNLTIDGTGTTTSLSRNIGISGNLTVTAGTLDLLNRTANRSPTGGGTISVANLATLKIGGGGDFPSGYATVSLGITSPNFSTVEYNGTSGQIVSALGGVSYGNLILTGSSIKTIGTAASQTVNIAGDLKVNSGATYRGTTRNPAVNLQGNFENNGTFQSGTSVFKFNGSGAQTITGTAAAPAGTTISLLTLDNAFGLTLTGTHNVTASGVNLVSGRITTGANVLIISGGALISNASSTNFVIGNLQKRFASGTGTGTGVLRVFEVGTEPGGVPRYAPVSVNLGNVSNAGNLQVSSTSGDHPQISGSTLDGTKSVNRYWTLATISPLNFTNSANNYIEFTYLNPTDFNSESVTPASLFVSRYSPAFPASGAWTEITPANLPPKTTISGSGITSATINGDYQIANKPSAVPNPGSFDVFETSQADAETPKVIRTKVASATTGFTLSVMAIQAGAKLTTFTGTGADVKVELLGRATTGGGIDANNCPTGTPTVLEVKSPVNITSGRSNVDFAAVPNSWRDVRVRVTYPVSSPTVTSCSTDNFAIRPASFTAAVTDTEWSTAGTARALDNTVASGGRVHKAGRPFTITLTPSPATATNYTDRTIAVGALTCVLAGTCTTSMLNVGAFTGNGTQVSTNATFSEVGAFNLTLQDQDYASVDSSDTTGDCSATGRYVCDSGAPRGVGRFVPDHFAVTQVAAPIFRTFDTTDASCSVPPSGPRRSFTYIGQYFGYQTPPSAMIVAQNAGNQTTANYRGTLWNNVSAAQQFDNTPAKALDITQIGSPVVAETPNTGTGTLTPAAAGKLAFQRDNSTPQAELTANLSLTLSVKDASEAGTGEVTVTPIITTTPLVFSSIAFDGDGGASGKSFRYGRLQIGAARGEVSAPLAVPMETQYSANGTTFTTNTADHCTTLDFANIGLGNFAGNLATGETTVLASSLVGAFTAGKKSLTLTAPGTGNNGSVEIVANLGAATPDSCTTFKPAVTGTTGANKSWLRERGTCSTTYTKDPTGRATFGVRTGAEEMIHLRENF